MQTLFVINIENSHENDMFCIQKKSFEFSLNDASYTGKTPMFPRIFFGLPDQYPEFHLISSFCAAYN